jgi:hypothetical protein
MNEDSVPIITTMFWGKNSYFVIRHCLIYKTSPKTQQRGLAPWVLSKQVIPTINAHLKPS